MEDKEILKLQKYLTNLLGNRGLRVKRSRSSEAAEVEIKDEFIGTIYRDEEDDEVSYTFTMAILEMDLEEE